MARKKQSSKYDGYTETTKEFMTAVEASSKRNTARLPPIGKVSCNCWPRITSYSCWPRNKSVKTV